MCGGPSGSTLSVCYFCLVTSRNVTETQDKLLYHCLPYFLALSFMMEVMVWYFVSETQKVMTALILVVLDLLPFSQNCCYICLFTLHFLWSFSLQSHWSLFVYFYVNWLAANISLKCDTEGFDSLFFCRLQTMTLERIHLPFKRLSLESLETFEHCPLAIYLGFFQKLRHHFSLSSISNIVHSSSTL
jgi:hypothetical protein